MNLRFLFAAFMFSLLLPLQLSANETVSIGNQSLSIPLPAPFVRVDGLSKLVDQAMASMLPPSNRSLMMIATPADAARIKAGTPGDMPRFMSVQTLREAESQTISLREFKEISEELEKQFSAGGSGMQTAQSQINQQLKNNNLGVDLKLGETRSLGIYEKSPQAFQFGLMMKAQIGGGAPETIVASASVLNVKGKILYLYVYADFHSQADTDWSRTTLKAWTDSILAANPGEVPAGGFDWNSVFGKGLIGALVGGFVALLVKFFKRN